MKLCSIETTPNPNCMKLNLDKQICAKPLTFTSGGDVANTPEVARQLLFINGIRSVFFANDFITLTRESSADWQPILVEATVFCVEMGRWKYPERTSVYAISSYETKARGLFYEGNCGRWLAITLCCKTTPAKCDRSFESQADGKRGALATNSERCGYPSVPKETRLVIPNSGWKELFKKFIDALQKQS